MAHLREISHGAICHFLVASDTCGSRYASEFIFRGKFCDCGEMRGARKYAKNFTRNHDRRILGKIQKIEEIFVRRKIEKSKRGEGCKKKVCARVKIALDTLGFFK